MKQRIIRRLIIENRDAFNIFKKYIKENPEKTVCMSEFENWIGTIIYG